MKKYSTYSSTILKKYQQLHRQVAHALNNGQFGVYTQRKQQRLLKRLSRYERRLQRWGIAVVGFSGLMMGTPALQAQNPVGSEFHVNTYTTGRQEQSSVAMDSDGDFVVVWESIGQDGSSYGIYAQRYDNTGASVGTEFQVNTYTTYSQKECSVAMDSDGDFVVVWTGQNQNGSNFSIYGQRYDNTGASVGPEFQVNTFTSDSQTKPSVAMDSDGNFVVVWSNFGQDGSGFGISGQRYDNTGATVGTEFQVNTYTTSGQATPSVAMDSDGDFVVVWRSKFQDGSIYSIYGQRYDNTGASVGSEFQVNTYTTGFQVRSSVAMDSDGNFVVVWDSENQDGDNEGVYGQRYDNTGATVGTEFQVNTYTTNKQWLPSVAMDSDGGFVVAWQSGNFSGVVQDGNAQGIYAQRYDNTGASVGTEFQVNTYTTSGQRFPSVAMDDDGDFVVAWESVHQDGSNTGVYGQRYSLNAPPPPPVGTALQVNTYTTNFQTNPSAAIDSDGDFVVVWQSSGQDGHYQGIYGQRYDNTGVSVGTEFQVNTYTTVNQMFPSVAMDSDGDFVVIWHTRNQDEDIYGIYAQRYDNTGSSVGTEFRVNTYTTNSQLFSSVAMDSDGNFVVVWQSYEQDGHVEGIYGQRYDNTGASVGTEFRVNTYTTSVQKSPSVGMDSDGNFVVVWQSYGQNGNSFGIYGQRYDNTGASVGTEFQVNTYTTGNQQTSSVSMDSDGDFVVVWQSAGQDGSSEGIYAQRYDNTGATLGTEFQVNTYTIGNQRESSVSMDSAGDFVVTWQSANQDGDGDGVYGQRYFSNGAPNGDEFLINTNTTADQEAADVAMDSDGNFVVAWESEDEDGDDTGIFMKVYQPEPPVINELQVNTYTTQRQSHAAIAVDSDGDYVVVWDSEGQDGSNDGIFGQLYNSSGSKQGNEFQVNTYTTLSQSSTDVAMDDAGNFVVVWHSVPQDDFGIYGQRYNSSGSTQGTEFQIPTYTTDIQKEPSIAMDSDGDFVVVWRSRFQDGSIYSIFGQRYNSDGTPNGSEFQVNTYTTGLQKFPEVAMDDDGDFVVVWVADQGTGDGVYGQRFSNLGLPQGSEFKINESTTSAHIERPSISMDSAGGFVVVWQNGGAYEPEPGRDGDRGGIYAQRYNSNGISEGTNFLINSYTIHSQERPTVALNNEGDFIVTWHSYQQDGDASGVFGQLYSKADCPIGSEFQINDQSIGYQLNPVVGMDDTGNFVVVWSSSNYSGPSQDGDRSGVFHKQYAFMGLPSSMVSVNVEGSATVTESGSNTLTFRFTRSMDAISCPLTINFDIGGTAIQGTDYTVNANANINLTDMELTFPTDVAEVDMVLTLTGDNIVEENETIVVTILPTGP